MPRLLPPGLTSTAQDLPDGFIADWGGGTFVAFTNSNLPLGRDVLASSAPAGGTPDANDPDAAFWGEAAK